MRTGQTPVLRSTTIDGPCRNVTPPMRSKKSRVASQAPAKLNLTLRITGKRPDGYHDIFSVMVPVSLYDNVEVRAAEHPGIGISCFGLPSPQNFENIAARAAAEFHEKARIAPHIHLTVDKAIPVAAGLGGGSSDAASTLMALNEFYGEPLAPACLHGIAARLGADVPFFLYRRPCLATGIGNLLEPLDPLPALWYIIVMPPLSISTAWVYRNYKLELTSKANEDILNLLKKRPLEISRLLGNDLEKVTASHFPVIPKIKKALIEAGARGALMSGSGPSVFGVFTEEERLEDAAGEISSMRLGDVFTVRGL